MLSNKWICEATNTTSKNLRSGGVLARCDMDNRKPRCKANNTCKNQKIRQTKQASEGCAQDAGRLQYCSLTLTCELLGLTHQ